MFFHTGREFEIYSIGDGLYMQRVLNGVAAMSNDGILLQLVAFGLLIGLLIMGVRNVMAGGMKLEIGTFLAAFLLAVFLFGLRADVVVHDMSYVPGQKVQGDFTVANLPFGIAAIGSFVSTVGYTLTERMEQGYSIPAMAEMGMSRGGFGKILEWVNSIRLWEQPTAESPSSRDLSLFQRNLTAYIRECTLPGVDMGHICLESVRAAHDPLSMHTSNCTGGIGYGSHYRMVEFVTGFGGGGGSGGKDTSTYTCYEGHQVLLNNAGTGEAGFYKALGSVFPETVAAQSAQSTFAAAYESIGVASGHVQGVVLANAVGASLDRAMRSYEHRMSLTTLSEVMIEQASQQRLVQWAAEETMFRRIMRPMMAFFESLMYALAPFMALAVGLGTFGIATVFRYMMLTVWVSLWMPVLSIIQLFQITSVQHVVRALYDPMTGSDAMNPTSIAGAHLLRSEALEWMATGAALAAWTPAITMALVFSGAITASALAGKMQGQDTINEKLTAPDAVNAPPAIQRGSMGEYTQSGGGKLGGAPLPSIDWSNQNALQTSSVREAKQELGEAISNAIRTSGSASFDEADRRQFMQDNGLVGRATDGRSGAATKSGGTTASEGHGSSAGFSHGREQSASGFQELWGEWAANLGIGGKGAGLGVGMGQRTGFRATNTQSAGQSSGGGSDVGSSEQDSGGWNTSRHSDNSLTTMASLREMASNDVGWAKKLVNSVDNNEEVRAAQARVDSFRESADNTQRSGVGHSESVNDFVGRAFRQTPGGSSAVVGALSAAGHATNSVEAYKQSRAMLAANGVTGARLEAGAWTLALTGYADNAVAGNDGGMASLKDRAAALGDALDGAYSGQLTGAFHANTNQGVGEGLQNYQEGQRSMKRAQAPNINMDGMQASLSAGPTPVGLQSPGQAAGNTIGADDNLDPGRAQGTQVFDSAVERGEQNRDEAYKTGQRNIADKHQQRLDGSLEARNIPANVSLPGPGDFINARTFQATGSGNDDIHQREAAALREKLPDAPAAVINAVAYSNMQSRGLATSPELTSSVNSQVYAMSPEEYGTFLGYVDQANGPDRIARDSARSNAGDEYSPDVLQVRPGAAPSNERKWEDGDGDQ